METLPAWPTRRRPVAHPAAPARHRQQTRRGPGQGHRRFADPRANTATGEAVEGPKKSTTQTSEEVGKVAPTVKVRRGNEVGNVFAFPPPGQRETTRLDRQRAGNLPARSFLRRNSPRLAEQNPSAVCNRTALDARREGP